jgi:hypothetical protein
MLDNAKALIANELNALLTLQRSRPYVFRTRLERALIRTCHYAKDSSRDDVLYYCDQIQKKLKCVSDQSNQTSDGTLKSFTFLESDIRNLFNKITA